MKKTIILITLLAIFCACSSTSKNTIAEIASYSWKLTQINGKDINTDDIIITLNFDVKNLTINGSGGCNNYFGKYKTENNKIEFVNIGATKMLCPDNNETEDEYFKAINKKLTFEIKNNKLTFVNNNMPILIFEKK